MVALVKGKNISEAKKLSREFPERCPEEPNFNEVAVNESIVQELSNLEESFASLAFNWTMALEDGLEKNKFCVQHLVRRIKQEQLYKNVSELNENVSLEDLFHIIGNFYHFLNCCLLISSVSKSIFTPK